MSLKPISTNLVHNLRYNRGIIDIEVSLTQESNYPVNNVLYTYIYPKFSSISRGLFKKLQKEKTRHAANKN